MSELVFSSWGGQVIDNRSGKEATSAGVELSVPFKHADNNVAAFISWDGLMVADKKTNVVALVRAYMDESAKLACGECSVGYNGLTVLSDILCRIAGGRGQTGDVDLLQELAENVQKNVKCDFCANAVVPLKDALRNYREAFDAAASAKDTIPAVDYIKKVTAPCQEACPIHQDVPGYIELIRNRRNTEALNVIRRTNCMPCVTGRTCVAFCEKNCVRNDFDAPLSIRALKRVPADMDIIKPQPHDKVDKDDKVAIIGAGPAGLSAAHYLSHLGYQVQVYDEQPVAGGMTFTGIPSYRLPRNVLAGEIETIVSSGVLMHLDMRIRHVEDLHKRFKAVLVATGAHQSRDNGIDNWNSDYDTLIEGVKFLRDISTGKTILPKNQVLVVGGGNTAIDCARSAKRLGCKDVTVVYRRGRNEMPARDEEVKAAEEEGVKFQFLAVPTKIHSQNSKVVGAECIRMELGEPDASGRRKPVPIKNSEYVMSADMVLTAIGEAPDVSFMDGQVGLTSWNSVKIDENGNTSLPWLFAAGDCASGPASIVEAMAAGKRAAESIHAYISKSKVSSETALDKALHEIGLGRQRRGPKPVLIKRLHPHEVNAEDRIKNFEEVEECFNLQAAAREAKRCLRCYRVMLIVKRQG
ncbi:MAG: FAD-dependent oxidoreductase [Dehalococcoidia bacterium]|nr:FAD-dependent oxidoreductase [Dehalococcoidia bacterium]